MIESSKRPGAKYLIDKFMSALSKGGYVPSSVVVGYNVWLFVIDFIDKMYDRLTDEDFDALHRLLLNEFSQNKCLIPYINGGSDFVNTINN